MIFSDTQRRSAPWSLRPRLAASLGRLPALCRRARVLAAFLILFLLGLAITAVVPAARAGSPFRVGVARRDITPLEPVPMWGYGARHDALSTGVLDRLYATALVMQAGDKKLAIVGLDLGRSPSERSLQRIRARIKSEAAIDYSLIAGSHTHHGPVLELTDEPGKGKGRFDAAIRYYQHLEDAIVAAIVGAVSGLTPARIGTGSIQLQGFNKNRHTRVEPSPSDRELSLIRFDDLSGKQLAVLVNFAAHPTNIPPTVLQFSADYVGAMRDEIEKQMNVTAVFMQGAAGDQSANKRPDQDYLMFGQTLGQEVVKLASTVSTQEVGSPSLQVTEERFKFTPRVDLSNPFVRSAYEKAFFPELIPSFIDEYADGVRPRLTVVLLNNEIALVGASGEFFSSHSIRLKERARVKQLFFFGYSNGYHQYFPTIEAAAEGGYGADSAVSPVAVGAGEQIMDTALIRIYQMLGRIR